MHEITAWLQDALGSPWGYLALFAVSVIDGFFPIVPSETSVITAGVFAASGRPNIFGVIAVAAAGAWIGDHISYFLGRKFGARVLARFNQKAVAWARDAITVRGGLILVVARYIPGGRTAVTLTLGSMAYPLKKFSFFTTIAAVSWALYSALIGSFGGVAFDHHPVKGLLFGLGLALSITVVVEVIRAWRRKAANSALSRESV